MNKVRMMFAGTLAGLMLLLGGGSADAVAAPAKKKASKSVCETSGRHDAKYRKHCMRNGTFRDALDMWFSVPVGRKGKENRNMSDRRSICKYAKQFGGIRPAVRELNFDVAYDTFLNHNTVLRNAGTIAYVDCRIKGYRV